ncbi:MAG: AbfB domain-containing protein, partial [Phycisphaerales bacterium]
MLSLLVLSLAFIPVRIGAVFGEDSSGHACVFESSAYPSIYIQHDVISDDGDCGVLYTWDRTTASQQKRSTFKVVPGLADSSYVSFESLDMPGYYVNTKPCGPFTPGLSKESPDTEFQNHATFKIVRALTGEAFPSVSIESYYYPGKFIYQPGPRYTLQIRSLSENSDDESKKAATFVRRCLPEYEETVALGFLCIEGDSAIYMKARYRQIQYSQTPEFQWRFDLKPGTSGATYPYVSAADTFGIYNTEAGAYLVRSEDPTVTWDSSSNASVFQWRIEGVDEFRLWSLEAYYRGGPYILDDFFFYPPEDLITIEFKYSPVPSPYNMKFERAPDPQAAEDALRHDPLGARCSGKAQLFRRPEILLLTDKMLTCFTWERDCLYQSDWPMFKHGDALAVGDVDGDVYEELIWASHENNRIYVSDMYDRYHGRPYIQAEIPFPFPSDPDWSHPISYSGNYDPDSYPLLAAADLDGDGVDEILFAQQRQDGWSLRGTDVFVHDGCCGSWWERQLPLTYGEKGDRLAAGDVDGDGRDEVIYGDRGNKLFVYDTKSNRAEDLEIAEFDFDNMDGLAVGDLNLDGIDEIVVASSDLEELQIITPGAAPIRFGGLIGGWEVNIQQWDGLAVGDVDHDGYDEIVLADRSDDMIRIFKVEGTSQGRGKGIGISKIAPANSFDWDFDEKDVLVLGDINSDSVLVGDPGPPKKGTVVGKTLALIHAPPTHRGLNDELNKYYAEFSTADVCETKLDFKSVSSSVFTAEAGVAMGSLIYNAQAKLTSKTERRLT